MARDESDDVTRLPRLASALLRVFLPACEAERALADLEEVCARRGAWGGARRWRVCMVESVSIVLWSLAERGRRLGERSVVTSTSRRSPMIAELGRDIRHGVRGLRRSPGFTTAALLTLALGIGANVALFSVMERVLLRPVGVAEPERVVVVGWDWGGGSGNETWGLSPVKAQLWKEESRTFGAFAITDDAPFVLTGEGEPEQLAGELVSAGYFDVMGVRPVLGRAFSDEDDRPGGPWIVILTDGLWRRRFGADPGIIGREIMLNRERHRVIGVMPAGFRGAREPGTDILAPLRLRVDPRDQGHNYFAFGRLAPGTTPADVRMEATVLKERVDAASAETNPGGAFATIGYSHLMVGSFVRTALWVLFGAVLTILLIACANVTNLVLGRADARRRELALRVALGANRPRIVGQLITETVLLALAGGAVGLGMAYLSLHGIVAFAPASVPGMNEVELNAMVVGFALVVSVVVGCVLGVVGVLPVLRTDLAPSLRSAGRSQTSAPGRLGARGLLIATEAAGSVVLVVGAGLLLTSLDRLRSVELGFDPRQVYTIEVRLPTDRYATTEATWRFEQQVLERLRALPGVSAAGSTANLPLVRGLNSGATVHAPGEPQHDVVEVRSVSPDYLDVVGARLVAGRAFSRDDAPGAPPVALVNEAFARRFFDGQRPLDAVVAVDGPGRRVVGVVRDMLDIDIRQPARPTVFLPRPQASNGTTRAMNEWFVAAFAVRADAGGLGPALQRAVQEVDPDQPVLRVRSLRDVVLESIASDRFNTRLLTAFAALALVLTAIGVYGVVSYSVGLRTHEIGLRMALGAGGSSVIGLVVRRGMVMVGVGLAIGLVLAFALSRMLASIVFQVSPSNPATFATVTLLICGVALVASYLPARRAARLDPMQALRAD